MVISDFKVFIVFVALGLPFPQVHLSVGGGGGQQASSVFRAALHMVISDFIVQGVYSVCSSRPAFPTGPSVYWGGGGGGGSSGFQFK